MATITNIDWNDDYTGKTAQLDGITFNSIQHSGTNHPQIFTQQNNVWADPSQNLKYSVNAVDIDWNAAVLPHGDIENDTSKTIYTTGDLLKLIDKMHEEIYVLSAAVIALGIQS